MRILHVSSGNLYGGIETILRTLGEHRHLCPEMQQHFALCFKERLYDELNTLGAHTDLLGEVRVRNPLSMRKARRVLLECLRERKIDIAICHGPWAYSICAPAIRESGSKLAFWAHGVHSGRHWLERWAKRTTPDFLIANSRFTAASLRALFPNMEADVVYCPITPPHIPDQENVRRRLRRELNTGDQAIVIVQVSRMESLKGHVTHLQALAELKEVKNWVCWQVGGAQRPSEFEYLHHLQMLARELGISDRVRFVGQRADVDHLLVAADVYCQPNHGPEGFGIAFIEALHAGLPVVTTNIGAAQEIVTTSCGILVTAGSAIELSKALRTVVQDSSLRRTLGSAAPARARGLCDPLQQLQKLFGILTPKSRLVPTYED